MKLSVYSEGKKNPYKLAIFQLLLNIYFSINHKSYYSKNTCVLTFLMFSVLYYIYFVVVVVKYEAIYPSLRTVSFVYFVKMLVLDCS